MQKNLENVEKFYLFFKKKSEYFKDLKDNLGFNGIRYWFWSSY